MFRWLGRLFGARTAVEASRDNPVLHAVVSESAVIYDRIPLRDFITEQTRSELGRQLFLKINAICNAADPVQACREKLATSMLKFASSEAASSNEILCVVAWRIVRLPWVTDLK